MLLEHSYVTYIPCFIFVNLLLLTLLLAKVYFFPYRDNNIPAILVDRVKGIKATKGRKR